MCRYFVPGRYPRTDMCSRFIAYKGRGKVVYEWTDSVRFSERKCGSEGRLFEPREKKASRDRQELWKYLVEQDE
jgi:hypothetical protein